MRLSQWEFRAYDISCGWDAHAGSCSHSPAAIMRSSVAALPWWVSHKRRVGGNGGPARRDGAPGGGWPGATAATARMTGRGPSAVAFPARGRRKGNLSSLDGPARPRRTRGQRSVAARCGRWRTAAKCGRRGVAARCGRRRAGAKCDRRGTAAKCGRQGTVGKARARASRAGCLRLRYAHGARVSRTGDVVCLILEP